MASTIRAAFALSVLLCIAAAAPAAVVRGTVSTTSGARLSGKVVAAYDTSGALRGSASTDSAGTYILTVPAGSYRLLAYDPAGAYATTFHGNAESFETTAIVQVTEAAAFTADFVLVEGGTLTGSVMAATGQALGNAVVEAYNLSGTRRGFTTTSAGGAFSIVLPPGTYKLIAYDPNAFFAGQFWPNAAAFADAGVLTVTASQANALPAPLVLPRAARAGGVITEAGTSVRLGGILVYAYTAAGARVAETTTDASGAFRFALAPGQYRFVAADPQLRYAPSFFAGSRSFETSTVVTLSAGQDRGDINLGVPRGAVVSGRVNGPANAVVVAYNADGTQHTTTTADAQGNFRFAVAPGDYRIAVLDFSGAYAAQFHRGANDFGAASEIRVLAGQSLTLADFSPPRAGRFTGTVRDAASQAALGGITVAAYDAAGVLVARATTAANGTYSLSVPPGQYRLVAFDDRHQYATAYANGAESYETTPLAGIAADAAVTANFAMRRGTRVGGTVQSQSGGGIDGVEVFALDAAGNRVAGAMTAGGAFELVVVPGTYRIVATDPRHRYFASALVTVTVGVQSPAPLTITLVAATKRRAARS